MPPPLNNIERGRKGVSIGHPIVFLTLVGPLDNSDPDRGRREGMGWGIRNGDKDVSPPIKNGEHLTSSLSLHLHLNICLKLFLNR